MPNMKIFAAALLLTASFAASAQTPAQPVPVQFAKAASEAKENWDFDSRIWESAGVISNFKVLPPREGGQAKDAVYQTEVRLLNDEKNFYFKFTATDSDMSGIKVMEHFDDFTDDFPSGDHIEIWMSAFGTKVFAFDLNRNKTVWHNFEQKFCHGFKVKTRRTDKGWEAIAAVPISEVISNRTHQKGAGVSFVRYADHGKDGVEFSTSTGRMPSTTTNIPIAE